MHAAFRLAFQSPPVEAISTFDIFKIGVGPSSSHTMGPWRAAQRFLDGCRTRNHFDRIATIRVDLYGSLAKTGHGHGTDVAVILGLAGEDPVTCDTDRIHDQVDAIRDTGRIALGELRRVPFRPERDVIFHADTTLLFHPNGLTFTATLVDGGEVRETYYSVGGGFVVRDGESPDAMRSVRLPMPIDSAADLQRHCREHGLTIPQVVWQNELAWR